MHQNFYFLRQLSIQLARVLEGAIVSECFSQHKDELIIRFETSAETFYIKASLQPVFSCLSFPEHFTRARKNSVDLFTAIVGRRVVSIRQFQNERSFAILFEDNIMMIFKMHGKLSNILLVENDHVLDLFKNNLERDNQLTPDSLDRDIPWDYQTFLQHQQHPVNLYVTFGKSVWHYLERTYSFSQHSPEDQYALIIKIKTMLENPVYTILENDNALPEFSLLPAPDGRQFQDPISAINEFFHSYTQTYFFNNEKNKLVATLQQKIKSSKNFYEKNFEKLSDLERNTNYKHWADLIMANLHTIHGQPDNITVDDFYTQQPITIKLKPTLNAQRNAEMYYRKAKNQQIEIDTLSKTLSAKEHEIHAVEDLLTAVLATTDLKSLRAIAKESPATPRKTKKPEILPYHEFETEGYKIWVGRNAQCNDVLTLKLGYKDDLWLHAKDVVGSHVLVKYQAGKNFPKTVIERAAQLAAYNSKRKNDSLCPVIVTQKKFVRKRKGDPAGAVAVEREDIIMVEPKL